MNSFRVDDQIALVTGAGSGLGRQFAVTLAQAGATVVLAARRRTKLEETAEIIERLGGNTSIVNLDITDSRSINDCMDEIEQILGIPDILVNNAGVAAQDFLTDIKEKEWDLVLDTNLKGAFLMAKLVAKRMISQKKQGSIINIASILGLNISKALGSYVASKSALVQLTKVMALEWSRYGIRVNALAPGYFVTEINQEQFNENNAHEIVKARVPMGRVGDLEEISGPLLLLASDAGKYMTGSILTVDGGHLCVGL